MARDYAKKTFSHRQKTKKQSHHLGLYLLMLFLFILFFTGLYYKKMQTAPSKIAEPPHNAVALKNATVPVTPQAPVFEFYTLLPKIKNNLPPSSPPVVSNNSSAPSLNKIYFLQVATMHNQEETDDMKAKLLLLGFDVVVKPIIMKGKNSYRISVGPYSTLAAMQADQSRLRENHINSILQTIK